MLYKQTKNWKNLYILKENVVKKKKNMENEKTKEIKKFLFQMEIPSAYICHKYQNSGGGNKMLLLGNLVLNQVWL